MKYTECLLDSILMIGVIIGNIMLLIPGLVMVNAFKALIGGEMITGLL